MSKTRDASHIILHLKGTEIRAAMDLTADEARRIGQMLIDYANHPHPPSAPHELTVNGGGVWKAELIPDFFPEGI